MKSSMRTRLIVIFSGMLILTICCMCLANLFLLPDFYQRTKVSQMKRVYAQTVDVCDDVDWGSQTAEQLSWSYRRLSCSAVCMTSWILSAATLM